jgi:hypothetical protein
VNVRISCPRCESTFGTALPVSGPCECPACANLYEFAHPSAAPELPACAACGNHELYKKKDFPHNLGMAILVAGFVGFLYFCYYYQITFAFTVLIGTLAFDTVLYFVVGDVISCYRCGAEHRGVKANDAHQPHEMVIEERYRQQRIREQELGRGPGPA